MNSLTGSNHISTVLDVRDSSQVDSWIDRTVSEVGALYGAVNLAGVVGPLVPFTDLKEKDWEFVIGLKPCP